MSGSPLLQLVSPDAEICLPGEAVGWGGYVLSPKNGGDLYEGLVVGIK